MNETVRSEQLRVAVTGTAWIGGGIGSVQTAIEELLDSARSEVQIAVYEITAGADEFLSRLHTCLAKGLSVTMIINRYQDKSIRTKEKLEETVRRYPYFELLSFQPENSAEDLHAKIIVVDRRAALVGSANLTWSGLVGNHELAIVVEGRPASTIASLMDKLCADPRSTRVAK